MANGSGLQSNGPRVETFSDYQVDLFLGSPKSKSFNIFVINRVREKFSYPLVPWTSTVLNLVVQNPRVLVQNVLPGS